MRGQKIKHELEAEVAEELGLSRKHVREVVTCFLSKVTDALTDLDEVHLTGFGRLKVVVEKPGAKKVKLQHAGPKKAVGNVYRVERKFRVWFKKSPVFKRIMKDKHGPSARKEKRS